MRQQRSEKKCVVLEGKVRQVHFLLYWNTYERISRKTDVYAFGVDLYAKASMIKIDKNEFE